MSQTWSGIYKRIIVAPQLPFTVNRSCHTWILNNRMNDTWLLVVCRVLVLWPGICISSEAENLTLSSDCLATVRGLGYVLRWWSGWIRLSHSPIARILGIIILVVSGIWYTNGSVVSQKSRHEWVRHWELSTKDSIWFPVWLLLASSPCPTFSSQSFCCHQVVAVVSCGLSFLLPSWCIWASADITCY